MRDSLVFYRSFYEAIKYLPDENKLNVVMAILEYALNENEPVLQGVDGAVFSLVKPQIDANNKKYLNGSKGGRPKTKEEPKDNLNVTIPKPNVNVNENVNVNVNENDKKDSGAKNAPKPPAKRFIPPSVENVTGYCNEKGYAIDAERFVDFYQSKGWMVGKNKMKDWKAAVRTWVKGSNKPVKNKEEENADTGRDIKPDAGGLVAQAIAAGAGEGEIEF